jgi:hypothetical protein
MQSSNQHSPKIEGKDKFVQIKKRVFGAKGPDTRNLIELRERQTHVNHNK